MSKLYAMQRMRYGAAAGDPFAIPALLGGAVKVIGGLFKKKGVAKVAQAVGKAAASPTGKGIGAAVAGGMAYAGAERLLGGGGGASGGWTRRRRRGITALELRGYRKVANLIHKEGMVSKRARGRH